MELLMELMLNGNFVFFAGTVLFAIGLGVAKFARWVAALVQRNRATQAAKRNVLLYGVPFSLIHAEAARTLEDYSAEKYAYLSSIAYTHAVVDRLELDRLVASGALVMDEEIAEFRQKMVFTVKNKLEIPRNFSTELMEKVARDARFKVTLARVKGENLTELEQEYIKHLILSWKMFYSSVELPVAV